MNRRSNRRSNRRTKKRSNKKKYDLYNGKKWDSYRLGDIIMGHFICFNKVCLNKNIKKINVKKLCDNLEFFDRSNTNPENVSWCKKNIDTWSDKSFPGESYLDIIPKKFPNSIGDKYIKSVGYPNTYKTIDFKTLKKIFKGLNYDKPDKDSLVIHLRLGDVLSKKYRSAYVYNLDYYNDLLNKIVKNKNIKNVDIVTGLHKNVYVEASNNRLHSVINIFKKHYAVKVILTKNPDKDFYYMCHSKYFVSAGGGFSKLVTQFLKYNKTSKIYY